MLNFLWNCIVFIFECITSYKFWGIITFLILINTINTYLSNRNLISKEEIMLDQMNYNEEVIIGHLNYIIIEALNYYNIMNIGPKNIYYINSDMQQKIVDYLIEIVPQRISPTLMYQLQLVYNKEYIGKFLGEHIYMIVMNYVLDFNTPSSQIVAYKTPGGDNNPLGVNS